MFRYRYALIALAVCLVPAIAKAQAHGPWELELGGAGDNSSKFNGFAASANASVSYFFTDELEFGVRQNIAYSDVGGAGWNGTTALALDFNLPLGDQGQIMPYVGGNVGYSYGNDIHDTWVGGPEAGVKVFVNNSTFVYFSAAYEINFDRHSTTSTFSEGEFIYGLGLGLRF